MEKVIITGADGFVGSYTVKHFLNEGKVVLALDMGSVARRLEAHPNLTYMQCDITNTQAMLENIEHDVYDTFIHFAWAGSADAECTQYGRVYEVCKRAGLQPFCMCWFYYGV